MLREDEYPREDGDSCDRALSEVGTTVRLRREEDTNKEKQREPTNARKENSTSPRLEVTLLDSRCSETCSSRLSSRSWPLFVRGGGGGASSGEASFEASSSSPK